MKSQEENYFLVYGLKFKEITTNNLGFFLSKIKIDQDLFSNSFVIWNPIVKSCSSDSMYNEMFISTKNINRHSSENEVSYYSYTLHHWKKSMMC